MRLTFNPRDPREVADMFATLRLLGAIDAAVRVTVEDEPTLSAREAVELQRQLRPTPALAPSPSAAPGLDLTNLGL